MRNANEALKVNKAVEFWLFLRRKSFPRELCSETVSSGNYDGNFDD
jgi:hypothetical protein